MAEKNFFDLLKEKMAALRPSTRHREADWAALTARLNEALPRQQSRDRRRAWAPLLLLLLALISSNALWWRENRENQIAMQRVERQLAGLQTSFASFKPAPPVIRTDTVWKWRTVYVQAPNRRSFAASLPTQPDEASVNNVIPIDQNKERDAKNTLDRSVSNDYPAQQKHTGINTDTDRNTPNLLHETARKPRFSDLGQDTTTRTARAIPIQALELPELVFLKTSGQRASFFNPDDILIPDLKPHKPIRPFGPLLLNALKPKFVKVGAVAGWLHPLSPALMHQVGFEIGARGVIGFSRHWSLILEYTYGQLHYEASKPTAILGSPEFPALPSPDHYYAHLDLKRQPLRQFGLGLRYTFSEWGKTRPYIGLNWGNQAVLPYTVEYEVQHEPSGVIQPASLIVDKTTRLRNVLRLGAGLEVPLSRRFDLTIEGFYTRHWNKKNKATLDPMGLRLGANWAF